ncbi:bifunctional DNA-binding transcriptional regulator/O6-methylguanine-DNA methyltransferase Ada [Inquilinus limosus]|uniref:Bifunctional transcriptional regulator/O6-methylguanine-DNA methyltransferase n=1 Tax=Inquilinus limosus TaxID=171674 RepID=A0A211ZG69_9PROT|nr:bifunctional DNA-binding transcriptional regulator/O6-methylguanine-DNA methyltransferase Ada [Inquilinus limosus]OWJ64279.1 bifunctional transcriptional regulator/O6-methylguanine-DNA methyltransferase [Inquilinus limosus]
MGFIPPSPVPIPAFANDEARWAAVQRRDRAADGAFVFAVRTTGIYCRPSCASRHPRRENASFHPDGAAAERAGFRPCLRCKPNEMSLAERQIALVVAACRKIETAEEMPSLDELAEAAGLSRFHFHRMFKAVTGVTPKAYADAHRADRMRDELEQTGTVTEAIYGAGFNSNGRFYAAAPQRLGMTPTAFRDGGTGAEIRFAIGQCHLGDILVAATDKGIVAIQFGDDPQALLEELQDRFPKARLVGGDAEFEQLVARVVGFVEAPSAAHGEVVLDLPLDIRGTAFQQKVWQALRGIPAGSTASYAEIAKRIGRPKAVRAVAQACATNDLAVAIPCHRVVRSDGDLSGYRWGVARKRALLEREAG